MDKKNQISIPIYFTKYLIYKKQYTIQTFKVNEYNEYMLYCDLLTIERKLYYKVNYLGTTYVFYYHCISQNNNN